MFARTVFFQEGFIHSLQRKRQNGHIAEEKSNGQMSKCRTDAKTSKEGEFVWTKVPASSVSFGYDYIWWFWNMLILFCVDKGKKLEGSVEGHALFSEQTEPPGKKQKNHG